MVKSKKLSRGSLAVLLLALLLALSMVVGMTGAWFTDKASQTKNKDLTLAKVVVTATQASDISTTLGSDNKFDPGDTLTIASATVANAGDVDAYIYYMYDVSVTVSAKHWDSTLNSNAGDWSATPTEYELKDMMTASSSGQRVFVLEREENSEWAVCTDPTGAEWGKFAANASKTIKDYRVTFNKATGNFAYNVGGTTTKFVLNKGTDYTPANGDVDLSGATITITVRLAAYSIQADHVGVSDLNNLLGASGYNLTSPIAVVAGTEANVNKLGTNTGTNGAWVEIPTVTATP